MSVLPERAPEQIENPSTTAKIVLGKPLFFDPRLSSTKTISCKTCHDVFSSGTAGSVEKLEEVVRIMARVQLNKKITDTQVDKIIEFLKSLTGVRPKQTQPKLPQ